MKKVIVSLFLIACGHQNSLEFSYQLSKEDYSWINDQHSWPIKERVYVESFKLKGKQVEVEKLISLKKLYNNSVDLHESFLCYPEFYFSDFIVPDIKKMTGKNLKLFFDGAKDLKAKNLLSDGEVCKVHLGKEKSLPNKTTLFYRLMDDDSRSDLVKNKFPKKCSSSSDCFSGLCYEFKNENEFNKVFVNQSYKKQKTCLPLGFRFFPKKSGVCEIKMDERKTISIKGTVKSNCLRSLQEINPKLEEWMKYKSQCKNSKNIYFPLKSTWKISEDQFFRTVKSRAEARIHKYLTSVCP